MRCSFFGRVGRMGILLVVVLVLAMTSCTSVKRVNFSMAKGLDVGGVEFSIDSVSVNIDHVSDSLARQQVYQILSPQVKRYNQKYHSGRLGGKLQVVISEKSFWQGMVKRNSVAVSAVVLDSGGNVAVQETLFFMGRQSLSKVKFQHKYVSSLMNRALSKWRKLKKK